MSREAAQKVTEQDTQASAARLTAFLHANNAHLLCDGDTDDCPLHTVGRLLAQIGTLRQELSDEKKFTASQRIDIDRFMAQIRTLQEACDTLRQEQARLEAELTAKDEQAPWHWQKRTHPQRVDAIKHVSEDLTARSAPIAFQSRSGLKCSSLGMVSAGLGLAP
jgi:uncharacterized small protein (DUF1192 family)